MISPVLSEEMIAHDIVAKLFSVLCNVNRGVADMAVAKLASRVLLHLCKYEKTVDAVWCVCITKYFITINTCIGMIIIGLPCNIIY